MAGLRGTGYPEDVLGRKDDSEELDASMQDEAPLGEESKESDANKAARLKRAEKIRRDAAKKARALRE